MSLVKELQKTTAFEGYFPNITRQSGTLFPTPISVLADGVRQQLFIDFITPSMPAFSPAVLQDKKRLSSSSYPSPKERAKSIFEDQMKMSPHNPPQPLSESYDIRVETLQPFSSSVL